MSALRVLARGQAAAEALMIGVCEIRRPPTQGEVDQENGDREVIPGDVVYGPDIEPHRGKCKVQTYEAHEATPVSGEHVFTVQRYYLHIPVSAPGVQVNDIATVVDSTNSSLPGVRLRVAGRGPDKEYPTAQRLLVDLVTA